MAGQAQPGTHTWRFLLTTAADSKGQEVEEEQEEELDLTGIDEEEIDSYLMSGPEIKQKTSMWLKVTSALALPYYP